MRGFILLFFLSFSVIFSYCQELEWNVNVHGFADNQEYSRSGRLSQTFFGTRFSPEVGLNVDSISRIRIGFNALHEFGDKHNFAKKIDPVIYYNYKKKSVDFYFGVFPRYKLLQKYPRALLKNTLQYSRPNLEGFLFNYTKRSFSQQIWIDWTARQTNTDRESFLVGASGIVRAKDFYFSHFLTLWHNAKASVEVPNDHLQDNIAFIPKIGLNLSKKTFLDSLDINVGGIISFDRMRNNYDWRTPKGVLLETYLAYKAFFIQELFYAGDPQSIAFGSGFYRSKRYNRLGLGWRALKYKHVEANVVASFHFTPDAMDNQQVLNLRYNFGGSIPLNKGAL